MTWLSILYGILSAGAFIVASLTLWFSHLRGPDIDLCNIPKVEAQNPSPRRFMEYIPYWFELAPTQLVFSNSGSRGGVISSVYAKFQPSKGFKPFFDGFSSSTGLQGPIEAGTPGQLPVSIKEGNNCVIELQITLSTFEWREHLQTPQISDILNLRKFVDQSLEYNRKQFSNFLKFLESREPFGTITFYMVSTSRRWLKTRLEEKKLTDSIEVLNTFDAATIKAFALCLDEWNHKYSLLEQSLQGVTTIFNDLIQRLEDNLTHIDQKTIENINLSNLESELRQLNERCDEISRIVMQREMGMRDLLNSLSSEIKKFNTKTSIIKVTGATVEKEQIKDLEAVKLDLKNKIEEALRRLRDLRVKLGKEVLSA